MKKITKNIEGLTIERAFRCFDQFVLVFADQYAVLGAVDDYGDLQVEFTELNFNAIPTSLAVQFGLGTGPEIEALKEKVRQNERKIRRRHYEVLKREFENEP